MLFVRLSVLTAVALFSHAALAQSEPSYPPLQKDLPPGYELTSGSLPAILGVSPGMARGEVEAVLAPLLSGKLQQRDEVEGIKNPDDGREFAFLYRRNSSAQVKPSVEGGEDEIAVDYTTDLTGGRVKHIKRSATYWMVDASAKPNFESTVNAIVAAYGQPTFRQDVAGTLRLYFVYWQGALDPAGSKAHFEACQYVANDIFYSFEQARTDTHPDCTALIEVDAVRDSDVASSLLQLDVELTDWRRSFDDAAIADKFLLDGMNSAAPVQSGPQVKL